MSRIGRRPYMSESLPKTSVATAEARPGSDIDQEKSAMPFRSAAMRGRAMFRAFMKKFAAK